MALVYTGYLQKQQRDTNPNSLTYGPLRSVDGGYQPTKCKTVASVTYKSQPISELVFRNDCAEGYFGGAVVYQLPEGHYVSALDQEDADKNAQAYFESTKQGYANSNGSCSLEDEEQPIRNCPDLGFAPVCDSGFEAVQEYYTTPEGERCVRWRCVAVNGGGDDTTGPDQSI